MTKADIQEFPDKFTHNVLQIYFSVSKTVDP